uniref:Kinesin-like protein n=1 Tax=Kalanchoe fedtschenkoi TaxID=63787 RepID=A0A7N0R9Q4_KALFE
MVAVASDDDQSVWSADGSAGGQDEKIFVSVRLRPLNEKELVQNDVADWECINNTTIMFKHAMPDRSLFPTAYTFDRVFGTDASTKKVYDEAAKEVTLCVVNGMNASIFAYGQTSSGKTYTMSGVTEFAVADIYDYMDKHHEREFVLKFSAMEIYNEAVKDLLCPDSGPLRLLDDPERGTVVEKLTEVAVTDVDHLLELISFCYSQRQVGETALNETSSRSHQILRLTIESSARVLSSTEKTSTLSATVNFIDLAGSERASQTRSTGTRLKEGSHINRSLLTLGTVIRKLSKGRNGHVPYRDSKLTRILQNSLGGNARTAIICTMSPARSHVEQSRNTLLFASCAKEVTTSAQVNVVMSDKALVKQLQKELSRLENELKSAGSKHVTRDSSALLREKEQMIEKMEKEIRELAQQRDLAQSRIRELLQSVGDNHVSLLLADTDQLVDLPSENVYTDSSNPISRSSSVADSDLNALKEIQFSYKSNRPVSVDDELHAFEATENSLFYDGRSSRLSTTAACAEITSINGDDSDDACHEARCIEAEVSSAARNPQVYSGILHAEVNKRTAVLPVSESEDELPSSLQREMELRALKEKLFYMQKTIDALAKPQSTKSLNWRRLRKTRSMQSFSIGNQSPPLHSPPNVYAKRLGLQPETFKLESFDSSFDASAASSRKDSRRSSFGTNMGADLPKAIREYAVASSNNVATEDEVLEPPPKEQSDISNKHVAPMDQITEPQMNDPSSEESVTNKHDMAAPSSEISKPSFVENVTATPPSEEITKPASDETSLDLVSHSELMADTSDNSPAGQGVMNDFSVSSDDWNLRFEKLRNEIIELWHSCNVPLLHRTYFFLLFKGDPSDAIYMEVELRRLKYLQDKLSKATRNANNDSSLSLATSVRAINGEREMLCKLMLKRLSEKERIGLYNRWGINLKSKMRKVQLARRVWSDTKEISHIQDSADLVAKLVGIGQAPKEMFGLSFSPSPVPHRSQSWKHRRLSFA